MLYGLKFLQLRSEFRSLVAGAGTDGGVPYLAEQLHQTNHETVYLDFSIQSMKIAQFKTYHARIDEHHLGGRLVRKHSKTRVWKI